MDDRADRIAEWAMAKQAAHDELTRRGRQAAADARLIRDDEYWERRGLDLEERRIQSEWDDYREHRQGCHDD